MVQHSLEMVAMAGLVRLLMILVSTASLSTAAPPAGSDTSPDYLLGGELGKTSINFIK